MTFNPSKHIINLRGKEYLQVNWRVVWFRDVHPEGEILTEVFHLDPLIIKATIAANGKVLATGHGSANAEGRKVVWTGREIEKAETAAIGRALAHAGFGTQFTGEDEGNDLADSPVERKPPTQKKAPRNTGVKVVTDENGEVVDPQEYPQKWLSALVGLPVLEGSKLIVAKALPHAKHILELSQVITPDAPIGVAEVKALGIHYRLKRQAKLSETAAMKYADTQLQNYLDGKNA